MNNVVTGEPYTLQVGGVELAKVLFYYGLIPDTSSTDYKIVCPFHEDVNPSMIVNLESGTFFCFGCNVSGDAIRFVELMNKNLNTLQSVLKFFKILNSTKVEKIDFSKRRKTKKENEELYNIAYDYYYGLSKINWLNPEDPDVFKCRDYMKKRGFKSNTLNRCGAKITYNKQYPIVFPMLDNDTFKGWVCRTTNPEVEKKRKYLYNEGFMRRNTLVGTYGNKDYVFVVEGYMDRLKFIQHLHSLGLNEDVVAILGWKMSKEQEDKLKQSGVKYIISALDNDECGVKGTKYLRTIFDNVTRFCYNKNVKDIGEMNLEQFSQSYNKTINKFKRRKTNGFARQNQRRFKKVR